MQMVFGTFKTNADALGCNNVSDINSNKVTMHIDHTCFMQVITKATCPTHKLVPAWVDGHQQLPK